MFNARFVPDKLLEFILRDPSLRQYLLGKLLKQLQMKCASIPVAEIGIARNPVRRRFVAYLDVQVLHLLDQKDPFQCPAIQIEKPAGGLVLARPATRGKKILQLRFLLHLSEFLGADRPTVDGPVRSEERRVGKETSSLGHA